MPPEKSAVAEFLKDDNSEKSPFEPEKTIFSEETPEEKVKEEVVEEKPLPFHKDPKIQRYISKEIEKRVKDMPVQSVEREFRAETEDEGTDILTRIIGNDTPEKLSAVKDFRKYLGSLEENAAQKALNEFQAQAEAQKEEDQKAQRELDDSFEEIEETYSVDLTSNAPTARKARSEFVDYIRKIAPKNEEGEVIAFPDLNAAFEEFQERNKRAPTNTRAKDLASRGMSRSSDASVAPVTGDKSWKGVDRFFSRFTN